jgi:HK97 family phage major capsid protein
MNSTLSELRDGLAFVESELRSIHTTSGDSSLDADTQRRWDDGLAYVERTKAEIASIEARNRVAETLAAPTTRTEGSDVNRDVHIQRRTDPAAVLEDRSATPQQLADAVLRSTEDRLGDGPELASARSMLRRHSTDTEWTRQILARSTPTYERAFGKLCANGGQVGMLSSEEQRAIVIGTNTAGGFMVPTVIDPTFIYTNNGTTNMIRQVSRVVTLTGAANSVKGIATAGITASWDTELEEVSDDAPAISQPSVTINRAQAFVPYSIESEQDIPGLADELRAALFDAKDRLEATAYATGTGSGQPRGIFTALDANTNVELTTTTAATVGLVDLHNVYKALPIRWRSRATWLMNPLWLGAIRQLGSAVGASFSGDLRDPLPERILGRPVVESDDAPSTQTTTALDNILVFGDFSNYVIADKPGSMMVEFIPQVFGATNSRPIGARALYAFWRSGANSVNDLAFRLLQDKTSA